MDIKKELELHSFCDNEWQTLIEEHGAYTDDIDDIVLSKASEKFGIDKEEVTEVFHKIGRIKIALSGDFTPENIHKAPKEYEEELNKK